MQSVKHYLFIDGFNQKENDDGVLGDLDDYLERTVYYAEQINRKTHTSLKSITPTTFKIMTSLHASL